MKLYFWIPNLIRLFRLFCILSSVILICYGLFVNQAISAEISGTVFLPKGQVAPVGGVAVAISFHDSRKVWPGFGTGSVNVDIPEGVSNMTFSLEAPDISEASWYLKYTMRNNSDKYYWHGFYASGGTSYSYSSVILLSGGQNYSNLDLTLIATRKISGNVPSHSNIPSLSESLYIKCTQVNSQLPSLSERTSLPVDFPDSYSIIVPDIPNALFLVEYQYTGNEYIPTGYYSSSGTTWNHFAATLLEGGRDHTGIDMPLISGKPISGSILGSPIVSFASDWATEITAVDVNAISYNVSSILHHQKDYTLRVPDVPGASWRISYFTYCVPWRNYEECQLGVVDTGYYAIDGTTWSRNEATLLEGGQDHNDVNLTYLPGKIISGTISIPTDQVGKQWEQIGIYAEDMHNQAPNAFSFRNLNAYGAQTNIAYSLHVADTKIASWRIKVNYSLGNNYYAMQGTTWNMYNATILEGGQNYSGIDLTLLYEKPVVVPSPINSIFNFLLLNKH